MFGIFCILGGGVDKKIKTDVILEECFYCVLISCDLLNVHTISATTVVEGSSLLGIHLKSLKKKMSGS